MPSVDTVITSTGGHAPSLNYTGSLSVFTTEALVYDVYTSNTAPNRTLTYQNGVWSDSGTDAPVLKDSNGNTITQTPSNPQSFVIDWYGQDSTVVNPYYTSGSGGGTSTEGLSYSGSLIYAPSVPDLVYTIPQTSAAGDYTVYSYDAGTSNLELTRTHTTVGPYGSVGAVPNFDPSNTHKLFSPLGGLLDTYSPGGVKKVHCNFW